MNYIYSFEYDNHIHNQNEEWHGEREKKLMSNRPKPNFVLFYNACDAKHTWKTQFETAENRIQTSISHELASCISVKFLYIFFGGYSSHFLGLIFSKFKFSLIQFLYNMNSIGEFKWK